MAVPKQKQSKSRTRKRRNQRKLETKALITCPNCAKPKLNHALCGNCGYYKGREILDFSPTKESKKAKSKQKKSKNE